MAAALAFDAINVELPTIAGAEVDPNTLPVEAVRGPGDGATPAEHVICFLPACSLPQLLLHMLDSAHLLHSCPPPGGNQPG